jgi:enoyl-CoA hydratase/carnithine racemase
MTRENRYAGGRLVLSREGAVATILLNQPERQNAISFAMWQALPEAVAAVAADEAVRVVLLRAAGGGVFSAGADIGEFAEVYADATRTEAYNAAVRAGQAALRHLERPVIAVIEGACIGGGCGLALASDLRFASDAARFAIPPARLGLAYSFADTAQLVEKIGPARAKDMLFSGRPLPADEALRIGLVDRVLPAAELWPAVESYAEGLAALSQTSIRAAKAIVNMIADDAPDGAERAAAIAAASFAGADFREGFRAFLEKRRPRFSSGKAGTTG